MQRSRYGIAMPILLAGLTAATWLHHTGIGPHAPLQETRHTSLRPVMMCKGHQGVSAGRNAAAACAAGAQRPGAAPVRKVRVVNA